MTLAGVGLPLEDPGRKAEGSTYNGRITPSENLTNMRIRLNVVEPWELANDAGHVIEASRPSLGGREAFLHCKEGTHLGRVVLDRILIRPASQSSSLEDMSLGPLNLTCAGYHGKTRCVDFVATGQIVY